MAADYFREIVRQTESDPEMNDVTAAAFHRLGFSLMMAGDPAADAAYERAIALYEALVAESPGVPALRFGLAEALGDRATMLSFTRGLSAAEAPFRRSLAIRREMAISSGEPGLLSWFAQGQVQFAALLDREGRPGDAEAARREILDVFARLTTDRPDHRRVMASAYRELGDTFASGGRRLESEQAYRLWHRHSPPRCPPSVIERGDGEGAEDRRRWTERQRLPKPDRGCVEMGRKPPGNGPEIPRKPPEKGRLLGVFVPKSTRLSRHSGTLDATRGLDPPTPGPSCAPFGGFQVLRRRIETSSPRPIRRLRRPGGDSYGASHGLTEYQPSEPIKIHHAVSMSQASGHL